MKDGFFGNAFDFNGDGNLHTLEQAFETAFVMDMIDSCEKENSASSFGSTSATLNCLDVGDIDDTVEDVGLDSFDLAGCLEEAGLDPFDF